MHIYFTMGRPIPVPSQLSWLSSVTFSSKIFFILSLGIPLPLSITSIEIYSISVIGLLPTCNQPLAKKLKSNFSILNETSTIPYWVCLRELLIKLLTTLLTFILWIHNLLGNKVSVNNLNELLPFLANLECVRFNPLMKSTLCISLAASLTSIRWCDLNSSRKLSNISIRSSSSLLEHSLTYSHSCSWSLRIWHNAVTGFFKSWITFITFTSFFLFCSSAICNFRSI